MSVKQTVGQASAKITALYERLSRDDDQIGDSNSIVNQKKYLESYAEQKGYTNCQHYTDDGWSGGNFNRPSWKRLISDIEAGKIAHVLVKDMSRIGRDYLQTGFYTEVFFRQHGVHFVAIANSVDSDDQNSNEFAPFLNIMNEWYLRDLSRKQRTAIRVKGESGKPTTNCAIYGYKKAPGDKYNWYIDEEAAAVVRRIFRLIIEGFGPYEIARILYEDKIETPAVYFAKRDLGIWKNKEEFPNPYNCSSYTLAHQKRTSACCGHYITTKALRTLILDTIRTVSTFAISNQDEFMEKVRAASQIRQAETAKDTKRKLNKDRKRIDELDTIIKKLYESFAVGRITEERFDSLLAEYEAEQKSLRSSAAEAETRLSSFEEDTARVEQFLALAKKYTDFSELTTPMINEFIDKIIVHAPERIDGDRVQEVEIHLRFIGRFELPIPELTAEEVKWQEQLRRHRIKSRERYQKIKAGENAVGKPFTLTCKCCGKTFESKRSNTLFCSPNCRAKFYRQEAAESRSRECVCENCGTTFIATRKDVKYCCDACRTEANRKMQKERNAAKRAAKVEPMLQEVSRTEETEQKQKTA